MGHPEWPMTKVTHWALDPWPMWPMTHGSPGLSPHTSGSLTRVYRLPGTVFGHCVCTHTFKLLHNCTCKQTAHTGTCKFRVSIYVLSLPQYISPAIELKNWWMMGQHLVIHDPCDPSDFRDPFDPWPIDPFPALTYIVCRCDFGGPKLSFLTVWLTPSTPAVANCCCSKAPVPYWSNPPFLIFEVRSLWRSGLSARAPECQKLKVVR